MIDLFSSILIVIVTLFLASLAYRKSLDIFFPEIENNEIKKEIKPTTLEKSKNTDNFISYLELSNAYAALGPEYVSSEVTEYLDTGVFITDRLYVLLINEQVIQD